MRERTKTVRTDYFTKYRPKGFTYWADIYCYDCGVKLPDIDPEGNEKAVVASWDEVYTYDENEQPCHCQCGECGEVIQ
jgi:hypothetical protein